ncbi:arylamine N-acetyltransferase [candidate division KSB1 bacterium]|nr:arylamine N-acetyltransferase [candidate division KSB1 bacterium]
MSSIISLPPAFSLDPYRHGESVQHFLKNFQITPQPPSLAFLQKIVAAFSNLPYENLSKILKFNRVGENERERLRLPEEIFEDHVRFRTGGTCFSLTFFLQSLLLQQGFVCYIIMGDMRAGPNIHCALVVLLEDVKYLLDPGYLLQRPMPLDPNKPRLYHNEFNGVELRFDIAAQSYDLFTFTREAIKWRYRFVDHPTPLDEFLQHWQASFHRNGMHGLCLTRVHADELIFVHKEFMRITSPAGKRNRNLKRNYHATIQEVFGIGPEYVEQALAALRENMARTRASEVGLAR